MADEKLALVTGGAGFVGSHLCRRLLKEGYAVISLDNYFAGSKDNHIDGVDYREGHTKDIREHVSESPDLIFHLGEYARVAPSIEEPEKVWDLNMAGSLAVLEFWREKKCKLIYSSSSTKFALERDDKVEGEHRAPYSWGKAKITELIQNYGRWYDIPYSIAYFYNVYGPGERSGQFDGGYGTVVETFKQCYLNDTHCTINGTGEQTRAFTHVDDTIDALMLIAEKGASDEYSLSAQEVYSLLDLARMFGLEIEFNEATKTTRSSGANDISKLELLGWKQKCKLEDYVETCKLEKQ